MGVLSQTLPPSATSLGLDYIDKYTQAVIKNEIKRWPLPPAIDRADLLIEVHISLLETFGPAYAEDIGTALLAGFRGEAHERVKQTFLRCVRRGIGRPQWAFFKRRQREKKRGRNGPREVPLTEDREIPAPEGDRDRALDLESVLASFDEQRRTIWDGLVAGRTLREIGEELGFSQQQVQRRGREVAVQIGRYLGIAGRDAG